MKRMYPTWEKEVDSGDIMMNKDRVYPGNRKHDQRNSLYNSLRNEVNHKNGNSTVQYSPRQRENFHTPSNDMQRNLLNNQPAVSLSNYHFGTLNPRQSAAENTAIQRLNREFSRVGMNSDQKTSSSHEPSFEQEENTSKDLLNVSLSDDNIMNDATVPVDQGKARKGKKDVDFNLNPRPAETDKGSISLEKKSMSNHHGGDMFLNNQNGETIGSESVTSVGEKVYLDAPSDHDRRVAGEGLSERQPSLVVTQSTPDIGKSSSEDEVSVKGAMVVDSKPTKCGYMSSHETSGLNSEAEVSEVEGVAGESGDNDRSNIKEMADTEQSPRPPTSFGSNQRTFEEPFQFSSSDADYDELENQMAALVEGKRNDQSLSKPLSQSGHESNQNVGSDAAENVVGDVGNETTVLSKSTEDEMYQQEVVRKSDNDLDMEVGNGDVSSDNMENVCADRLVESVDRIGQQMQDSDNFSEKEESFPARENVEETETGELYDADVIDKGSAGYDEVVENTSVSIQQGNAEEDSNQVGNVSSSEGIEHESEGQYYEEPGNSVENYPRESYAKDVYHDNLMSVQDPESGGDENRRSIEMEERHDSDYNNDGEAGFQVEQSNYAVNEPEEGTEMGAYTQDNTDHGDQREMKSQQESQEEIWAEEEKDEVGNMVHDSHRQPDEERENIGVVEGDENISDQREEIYGLEATGKGDNLEDEGEDKTQENYEAMKGERVEETNQTYTREENEESFEGHDEGKAENREEPERDTGRVGYDEGVTEEKAAANEESNVQDGGSENVEYNRHDEGDALVSELHDFPEGSHGEERELLGTDQTPYDGDFHGESGVSEETPVHTIEEEEKREVLEENYAYDTTQEVKEPIDKPEEQQNVEQADVTEMVDEHPKTEIADEHPETVKEEVTVKQEDRPRQSQEPKESHEVNKEKTVGGKTERTGETRAVSQKTTRRDEGQMGKFAKGKDKEGTRKDAEHSEKPAKEIPQVPSRPLSRQSTRKDVSSPDTYKAEKLKTVIRKFQAKKDTRQTVRRSTDSKK
ncbi:caldesmon-like isoform X2 [Hetaerina americana]